MSLGSLWKMGVEEKVESWASQQLDFIGGAERMRGSDRSVTSGKALRRK